VTTHRFDPPLSKAFVIGGAEFIGGPRARRLLSIGKKVVGCDNVSNRCPESVEPRRAETDCALDQGDLKEPQHLSRVLDASAR
jgi:UDP-glucose 4-epimerase